MIAGPRSLEKVDSDPVFPSASGQKVTWSDSRTHESGYFVALNTKRMSDGRICRDPRRGLSVGGEEVDETTGTACKKPNGQWDVG